MVDFSKSDRPREEAGSLEAARPKQPASANNATTIGEVNAARQKLWDAGITVRRQVVGPAHVDRSMAAASTSALASHNFLGSAQQLATEVGWGLIWTRPGLSLKTRSFMNLAMLLAMGKSNELAVHVRGAVRNGLSVEEIREALLHASVYAGLPAGLEGFRAAERVLSEMVENGELELKAKL